MPQVSRPVQPAHEERVAADLHRTNATAYIDGTRRIKGQLPGALVSGGVSNISFAFRGNEVVR